MKRNLLRPPPPSASALPDSGVDGVHVFLYHLQQLTVHMQLLNSPIYFRRGGYMEYLQRRPALLQFPKPE